jgi:uncharacterized membrane protein
MTMHYNRLAGRNLDRLAALSDGVFAVAMTLLVLDIHVPAHELIQDEAGLWQALVGLAPRLLTYLMSFVTLGIFWLGQQAQLDRFARADRDLVWIHIGFLALVSVMPLSTALLGAFVTYRIALLAYWLNIALLGLVLYGSWRYASRAALLQADATPELSAAMVRRIAVAQGLYAIGAALCIFGTARSIGFIALVQLNYALSPRWRRK